MPTSSLSDSPHLVVFRQASSSVVQLPSSGEVELGTEEGACVRWQQEDGGVVRAVLRITDESVSLRLAQGSIRILVNGVPAAGVEYLSSGDVITLGAITIGFRGGPRRLPARALLEPGHLRQRLLEETERFLRYESPFAVMVLALEGQGPAEHALAAEAIGRAVRRVDVVGFNGASELVVIFPETTESVEVPARRVIQAVLPAAPGVKAGLVLCPSDACNADALLGGARLAARSAPAGGLARLGDAARLIVVGALEARVVDPITAGLFDLIRQLAASDLPVLVHGETGAGKEVVAHALHAWSPRAEHRLVAMNCAAIPENLLESELFGYERGAFSGAVGAKPGLLETASGGTLFLDEVGDLSAPAQAKLLRVLETRRATRLGGTRDRAVDVRLVAATNRNLEQEAVANRFRMDLYFRLSAATVVVPPLRDRPLDMSLLAHAFLDSACRKLDKQPKSLSSSAMRRLALHNWPGNVRELKNLMDYLAASAPGSEIVAANLPERIAAQAAPWMLAERRRGDEPAVSGSGGAAPPRQFRNIYEEIEELERTRIREALEEVQGVRVKAAQLIGMPLRTMLTKIKQFGLEEAGGTPARKAKR
ncbi:MAG: sigma 54-interacting transcriptional regulator [Deltaproteobacteria bacterium]|nr:sigma 54-interacting transcriptional regulator [Deltaproteobacteria bacterium]